MKVTGVAVAEAAMREADRTPPISYKVEDCQRFVEQTVKRAGGVMRDYRGSNDMYRNAGKAFKLDPKKPPKPGSLLFIVSKDGEEPDRYKADKKGNAWHVGIYTGGRHEVVHSSKTRGGVAPSTLKNGWTHAMEADEIVYTTQEGAETGMLIRKGSDPEIVTIMQQRLQLLGYDLGKWGVDGDFGSDTQAAVRAFQADNDLPVTGVWTDEERDLAADLIKKESFNPQGDNRRSEIIEEIYALLGELEAIEKWK